MNFFENKLYLEDIKNVSNLNLPFEKLSNKTFLISGSNGLIGSFLIDVLMYLNNEQNLNIKIIALVRNSKNAEERFKNYLNSNLFELVEQDINDELKIDEEANFIVHLASNTHPKAYSTQPIGTILTNIIGTNNLLKYAVNHSCEKFVFASTCEIYGENKGDTEKFDEEYLGYINCNTLRAGYPESKRCGEALCQAYKKEKELNVSILRFSRVFGPTMLMSDTKALSQFIKNGLNHEDIVLKSEGNQFYSYIYVADAVSGMLTAMFNGENGEAYNISDEKYDVKLKDLAKIIADYVGTKVVFELPDEVEKAGYSTATKAILDNKKISKLGWKCQDDIKTALIKTIEIMKNS